MRAAEGLLRCAVAAEGPLDQGDLRWPNEFARHKLGTLPETSCCWAGSSPE